MLEMPFRLPSDRKPASVATSPRKSPIHAVEAACCSHVNLRHRSGGLHGEPVPAADQLLQGDRLVGGPRGLTIVDDP